MSLFPTYNRFPLTLVSGEGTRVTDENGKEYLDFVSGIAVCNLGHRPQAVQTAIEEQLSQLWHVSNLYQIPQQEEAAELLTKDLDLDYVFFCNSGAEANEAAIKLARKHTGKDRIVTFQQSFHGRTFATMSATGQEKVHQGFGALLPTFTYLPYNDEQAIQSLEGEDIAAIMVEVVQGEGGVIPGTHSFLKAVEEKCRELHALLIIDEVQTGIGRTGKRFGYEHDHLNPDIVTSAKGLGSGFPVGAMLGKADLAKTFAAGVHGSTFGGNPLASAAVKATVETIFNPSFLKEVAEKSVFFIDLLKEKLGDLPHVKHIRGKGMMIGVELDEEALPIINALREEGVLAVLAGPKVVRMLPPLTVTKEEMTEAVEVLKRVLQQVESRQHA